MRDLAIFVLIGAAATIVYLGNRQDRNPLMIDARSPWCDHKPGPPLIGPGQRYDSQKARRRDGGIA